jgi:uncharacterized protein
VWWYHIWHGEDDRVSGRSGRRRAAPDRGGVGPFAGRDYSRGDCTHNPVGGTTAIALCRGWPRERRSGGSRSGSHRARGAWTIPALIVDAGALYGAVDAKDPDHEAIVATLARWPGELVVSAFTAAEADHLVLSRLGMDAELALLDDLAVTYSVHGLDPGGLKQARELCARYRDLELGLADASVVVLAEQWSTHTLATFDERHFRAVTALDDKPFTLLPADSA